MTGRRRAAGAMLVALALLSGCDPSRFPVSSVSRMHAQAPAGTVPVATVLNEIRCDYLDFAYSDYARARTLAVGKVTGSVTLSVSRSGTQGDAANAIGVAVAPAAIRLDAGRDLPAATQPDGLTVAFAMDPQLALNPAAAGLDCAPEKRLAQPILSLTALAAGLTGAGGGAAQVQIRSPLHYRGHFYLLRAADGTVGVVAVRADPSWVRTDAMYLQSFDMTVETGSASWFGDVGPATAEPRPVPTKTPRPARVRSSRVVSVPQAPRPAGARREAVEVATVEHRCVGTSSHDVVCY